MYNMDHLIAFWPILKRLLLYAIPWKKKIIYAFFLLFSSAICEVLGPVLISFFIKTVFIQSQLNLQLNFLILLMFITLQTISVFFSYFQSIFFNTIAVGIINKLRKDVMQSTLDKPISYFDCQPTGKIISKITNDTEVIKELYDTVMPTLLRNIILIFIVLCTMFIMEWKMAIIATLIFPLIIIIIILYKYYSTPLIRGMRNYIAKINNGFHENINGMHVIQQFQQEKRFKKEIEKISYLHYMQRMKVLKLDSFLLRPLLSLISSVILSTFIFIFSSFPTGILEIGILYAFITYLSRLNEPLITITIQQSILQQAIVAGERIFKLMDAPKQKYGNNSELFKSGKINISDLSFCYEKNIKNTLNNINLNIPSRNFTAFIGHTGSGKSTLANLLMGYYPIKCGQIYLDDKPINSIQKNILRKNIVMIQQDPVIFSDTFFENITLGQKISEETVWKILKLVNLSSLAHSMSKGLNSFLGKEGNYLSAGQKQLLTLARILVLKPKILILDEATANIDSETEQVIQKTLSSIRKKSTLIVIAHRLSTIIEADCIVVLDKGRIIESGTHDQLLEKKGYYWEMYQF